MQWAIELEHESFNPISGQEQRGMASFDFSGHKIVVGLTFHFL
jgi:hypothetical protein